MAFDRPELPALRARIQADINGALPGVDSALRRNTVNVLALVVAAVAHGLYGFLAWIARQIMPDTAELEFLRRHASIRDVAQKPGVPAAGVARATGVDTSVIAVGTALQRGDEVEYVVMADAVIAGGEALVLVEAVAPGLAGNADAGAKLTFISPVAGVSADLVVQAPGLTTGADEESPEALLARLLERIRQPPQGGALADYKRWALEVAGVTRAWPKPGWAGPGSVGVAFAMDGREDIIPTAPDLAVVAAYIDPRRPVTANVVVFAPIPDPVALTISLPGGSPTVKAAIAAEVEDFHRRTAEPDLTTQLSGLREAVFTGAAGAAHTLTSPVANIAHAPGHMAVAGVITWTA